SLEIVIGADGMAEERLNLGAIDALVHGPFALALDPEPIEVAAYEAFTVPAIAVAAIPDLIFGEIEEDLVDRLAAILFHHIHAGPRHGVSREIAIGIVIHRCC